MRLAWSETLINTLKESTDLFWNHYSKFSIKTLNLEVSKIMMASSEKFVVMTKLELNRSSVRLTLKILT
jgi:hypothetical protein